MVKSAPRHLEKQNPFRAAHYLLANEEKGRCGGRTRRGTGRMLIAPSFSSPFVGRSVKRSDKKSTRSARKGRGRRKR